MNNKKFYYSNTLKIPIEYARYVRNDLKIINPDYINAQKMNRSTKNIKKELKFYKEYKHYIEVPRMYTNKAIPMDEVVDETIWQNPKDYIELNSDTVLRKNQIDALEIIKSSKGNKIIEMPTGSGKTVAAIAAICYFKRRTLILVHKTNLQMQWQDEIERFSNTKVGILGNGKFEIGEQYDIVIATAQSIQPYHEKSFNRLVESNFFTSFDVVVVDEAHNFSAETFNRCLSYFPGRIRLGFTATAFRNDNLGFVFNYAIGDTVSIEVATTIKPTVWECRTKWFNRSHGFFSGNSTNNLATLITKMTKDYNRNKILLDALKTFTKNERVTLFLTSRVAHAKLMYNLLKKSYPNKKISLLIGSTKEEERKAAKDALIIIATYGVAKEGFDVPLLDTLVYGTPISGKNKVGIIQSIGRLTREKDGKKGADVFDFIDDEQLFKTMYYKRRSVYHSMRLETKKLDLKRMKWGN